MDDVIAVMFAYSLDHLLGLSHSLMVTVPGQNNCLIVTSSVCFVPHLEYCSTVWSTHIEYLIDDMDRIQRRFLYLVGPKLRFGYRDTPLDDIAALLGLRTLDIRRVAEIFSSCIEFLTCWSTVQKSLDLFGRLHHATNYEMNSTINRDLGILLLGTLTSSMIASLPLKELLWPS
ncbi:hypothetical protein J6590_047065 [Homalodisca vitripennis]|nr:hypothetical protein J6590_047065 [Homalodisca vitripennis]